MYTSVCRQAFQFTLPRGERLKYAIEEIEDFGFNSRSRVGSDALEDLNVGGVAVSIHAPAWGATPLRTSTSAASQFQFTLPRGERPPRGGVERKESCFNSRSRVGSDRLIAFVKRSNFSFNSRSRVGSDTLEDIHVKISRRFNSRSRVGSDSSDSSPPSSPGGFNSRSRVGSDGGLFDIGGALLGFQFTLPRGERPLRASAAPLTLLVSIHAPAWGATYNGNHREPCARSFNSRSRVGSDKLVAHLSRKRSVSIHAPAWGATSASFANCCCAKVSIHAPAWGATPAGGCNPGAGRVSIHAPAWGATGMSGLSRREGVVSIHAPAWGATSCFGSLTAPMPRFNSRSRVGSDSPPTPSPPTRRGFNSRSRVGSDDEAAVFDLVIAVSIHAPAWGATKQYL